MSQTFKSRNDFAHLKESRISYASDYITNKKIGISGHITEENETNSNDDPIELVPFELNEFQEVKNRKNFKGHKFGLLNDKDNLTGYPENYGKISGNHSNDERLLIDSYGPLIKEQKFEKLLPGTKNPLCK